MVPTSPPHALLDAIAHLAETLPESAIAPLAEAIGNVAPGDWTALRTAAMQLLATPHVRTLVGAFMDTWQTRAPTVAPSSVALALHAAGTTLIRQRRAQTVELVWTGPASGQPLRRTAQVLQTVIDEARRSLLIVSFAVYDIPEIGAALLRAARRGVTIRLVIESAQASAGKVAFDGLAAFGPQVAAHAEVYCWPLEQRPRDGEGRYGSLHAKCAVADATILLISSANLTHYALNLNMELGTLIRGGPQPREVQAHILALIQRDVLTRVASPLNTLPLP